MLLPDPVILVPGITGTYLYDQYPISPERVWGEKSALGLTVGKRESYERIWLHPRDPRYEASEPSRVVPGQVFEEAYEEFIEEVRSELSDVADAIVPVFPFLYDWRAPLHRTQARLSAFVDEVLRRTMLIPHYYSQYGRKSKQGDANATLRVSLVGHSMGGLIIAGYLAKKGRSHRVGKVVTIATPFRGSCDVIDKMVTGKSRPRERAAARTTPATYYLLPSYAQALTVRQWSGPEPEPTTVFDPNAWQPSIVRSIGKYVRKYEVADAALCSDSDVNKYARRIFRKMLREAARHRRSIDVLSLDTIGIPSDDWLCIAGVNEKTRTHVEIERRNGPVEMILEESHLQNRWEEPGDRHLTGDGTVPLAAGIPRFLERETVVCVRAKYDRIREHFYGWVAGAHAMLLNTTPVQRLAIQHLRGVRISHKWDWGAPVPGVTPQNWRPPGRFSLAVQSPNVAQR